MHITIKTATQINTIRTSGQYLTELLQILYQHIEPGIQLLELERLTTDYLNKHRVISAFKDYNGFPGQLCLSLNDCIVHGIPDKTILQYWDVLKVDMGINYRGAISDSAFTIVVWWAAANPIGQELIDVTRGALDAGFKKVKAGAKIIEYSKSVYNYVISHNHSIIKDLTGHGVGIDLHEDPYIYNYPHPSTRKIAFKAGMVVALEPITAVESTRFIEDPNGRNLYTEYGDLGAQREYTVAITESGPEILAGLTSDLV